MIPFFPKQDLSFNPFNDIFMTLSFFFNTLQHRHFSSNTSLVSDINILDQKCVSSSTPTQHSYITTHVIISHLIYSFQITIYVLASMTLIHSQ